MAVARVTLGGVLVGAQRWSIGLSVLADGPAPDAAAASAFANTVFDDFVSTAWNPSTSGSMKINGMVGAAGNLDSCRVYYYPTGATAATIVGASTRASNAGLNSITAPPQCAVVVSLLTGLAGRANRGRIYVPGLAISLGTTTGQLTSGTPAPLAQSIANFITLLRTRQLTTGSNSVPIVAGATGGGYPITTVRVDSVVDTQRRRRDKVTPAITANASVIVP